MVDSIKYVPVSSIFLLSFFFSALKAIHFNLFNEIIIMRFSIWLLSPRLLMTKLEQFPEASACRLLVTRLYEYLGAIGPAVSKLFSILRKVYFETSLKFHSYCSITTKLHLLMCNTGWSIQRIGHEVDTVGFSCSHLVPEFNTSGGVQSSWQTGQTNGGVL